MQQLTAAAEDYLEHLYSCEVEQVVVPLPDLDERTMGELLRLGYLRQGKDVGSLTKTGRQAAELVVRRHRLAERLLHDVINVHGQQVDETACEFEHSLHHGIDEHICTLLGHPKTCPHGRPIPPGPCCRKRRGAATSAISPLADMRDGDRGTIAYLSSNLPEIVQKLMVLGVLPGAPVQVIQTFPSIVFQINQTQVAVDRALADHIYIRRMEEKTSQDGQDK
ncbi:MAG TPA: metal-dependent transcriptional regulator [Armatimonadota bacterium]|jgi:DtxR family Mn-dependent transcriptional regulator